VREREWAREISQGLQDRLNCKKWLAMTITVVLANLFGTILLLVGGLSLASALTGVPVNIGQVGTLIKAGGGTPEGTPRGTPWLVRPAANPPRPRGVPRGSLLRIPMLPVQILRLQIQTLPESNF